MSESRTGSVAWDEELLRDPHAVADKRRRVQAMFAAIATSYDLNNRLHSLWMDQRWRRKAVKLAELKATDVVVDVACGTGDLTLAFARELICRIPWRLFEPNPDLKPAQVLGIDFTYGMLPIAREKGEYALSNGWGDQLGHLNETIRWINGDALSLPLPDQCADVVSIAFGIRNVADALGALREFRRILRPGGRVIVLEFSLPTNRVVRGLYNFYFRKVLPRTATWISRDKTGAYEYLPQSVNTFIDRETMMRLMREAGFERVEQHPLTCGVCVCYRGIRA